MANKIESHREAGAFLVLAAVAIIASAFHFWPFAHSKAWQIFNIPNICCFIGMFYLAYIAVFQRSQAISSYIPHVSVLAYLVINILSISFAENLSRPLNYTFKLLLAFVGGFVIFQMALSNEKSFKIIFACITVAVLLSTISCLYAKSAGIEKQFGFNGSVFKYGTYVAILAPLCSIYFLYGSWLRACAGIAIVILSAASICTLGAWAAILAGLLAGLCAASNRTIRMRILICLVSAAVIPLLLNFPAAGLKGDLPLKEKDGINVKQRYIEWQAQINLLEKMTIVGTGAGCINDYRSFFYYRLPKLNTIKPYDQNGFLAVAGETGLLGLTTFCWIILYYGKLCWRHAGYFKNQNQNGMAKVALATLAAFVSTVIANIFSSVHYNGILLAMVLLLCLISSVNKIYGDSAHEA